MNKDKFKTLNEFRELGGVSHGTKRDRELYDFISALQELQANIRYVEESRKVAGNQNSLRRYWLAKIEGEKEREFWISICECWRKTEV
jgi:hypothetical protein